MGFFSFQIVCKTFLLLFHITCSENLYKFMDFGCKPFGFITAIFMGEQSATPCLEMALHIQISGCTFFALELVLQMPLKAKRAALSSCSSPCLEADETP